MEADVTPQEAADILRAVLGGDHRYRKFVRELSSARSDGLVHSWQSSILHTVETQRGFALPRRADELRALLPPLPDPPRLAASDVPSWLSIDELGGSAPVQGEGRAGGWRWYFRARHDHWSLGAVMGDAEDPVDVGGSSETTFYAEDEYGDLPDDASYMDLDEARFFIVRELTRLKESRGLALSMP